MNPVNFISRACLKPLKIAVLKTIIYQKKIIPNQKTSSYKVYCLF